MFGKKKKETGGGVQTVVLKVTWGGYYAQQSEEGTWSVFRLLDFNSDAYHSTLFTERFPQMPTFAEAQSLTPFAGHVPIATGQLVNFPATLIGESPITLDALYGYDAYLEHAAGMGPDDRAAFLQKIVGFGTDAPLTVHMSLDANGELAISIDETV